MRRRSGAESRYIKYNVDACKVQSNALRENQVIHSNLHQYKSLKGEAIEYIMTNMKLAMNLKDVISRIDHGVYEINSIKSTVESETHLVCFGDSVNYPSCDCNQWRQCQLPCVHMCYIFIHEEGWDFDRLPVSYRCNPLFTIDFDCICKEQESKFLSVATQTKFKKNANCVNSMERCVVSLKDCLKYLSHHPATLEMQLRISSLLDQLEDQQKRSKRKFCEVMETKSVTDISVISDSGTDISVISNSTINNSVISNSTINNYNMSKISENNLKQSELETNERIFDRADNSQEDSSDEMDEIDLRVHASS